MLCIYSFISKYGEHPAQPRHQRPGICRESAEPPVCAALAVSQVLGEVEDKVAPGPASEECVHLNVLTGPRTLKECRQQTKWSGTLMLRLAAQAACLASHFLPPCIGRSSQDSAGCVRQPVVCASHGVGDRKPGSNLFFPTLRHVSGRWPYASTHWAPLMMDKSLSAQEIDVSADTSLLRNSPTCKTFTLCGTREGSRRFSRILERLKVQLRVQASGLRVGGCQML